MWRGGVGRMFNHPESTFPGETQDFHAKLPDSQSCEPQPSEKLCLHQPLLPPSHHPHSKKSPEAC